MMNGTLSVFDRNLQSFKGWVDPPEKVASPDFRQMNHQEFSQFCSHIKDKVFLAPEFNAQALWKRVEALWLQMAFSLFIRHHAENIKDKEQKLQALNALDNAILNQVKQIIGDINYIYDDSYRVKPLHFHQKVLHIHWNLLRYFQTLAPFLSAETVVRLPLGLDARKLGISQDIAKNVREKIKNAEEVFSDENEPELQVNNAIRSVLLAGTRVQSLKAPGLRCYVDADTGLELDFPLSSKLSVETDGIKGHVKNGTHGLIHTLKALAFRESGGQRIPVETGPLNRHVQIAQAYAEILNNQSVMDFLSLTDKLNTMRRNLRIKLHETQQQYAQCSDKSALHKSTIEQYFLTLLRLENDLRKLANAKILERVFVETQTLLVNQQIMSKEIVQYKNTQQSIEALLIKKESLRAKLATLGESKKINDKSIVELSEQLEKMTITIEKFEQKLAFESERKVKHQKIYERAQAENNAKIIQAEKRFLKEVGGVIVVLENSILEAQQQNDKLYVEWHNHITQSKRDSADIEVLQSETANIEEAIANKEAQKQDILQIMLRTQELEQLLTNHETMFATIEAQHQHNLSVIPSQQGTITENNYIPHYSANREAKRGASHLCELNAKMGRVEVSQVHVPGASLRKERAGTMSY